MGYVAAELSNVGRILQAEVRGNRMPVTVCDLPFVAPRYKRN
jgi:aminomethyltransferase